jgi:hypothetical protein
MDADSEPSILKENNYKLITEEELNTLVIEYVEKQGTIRGDYLNLLKAIDEELKFERVESRELKYLLMTDEQILEFGPDEFMDFIIVNKYQQQKIASRTVLSSISEQYHLTPHINNLLKQYGVEKLATVFNRYKKYFLAMRGGKEIRKTINIISRLSKTKHVPRKTMPNFRDMYMSDFREEVNEMGYTRLVKVANYLKRYASGIIRIRNGRVWCEQRSKFIQQLNAKLDMVLDKLRPLLIDRILEHGYPHDANVELALPTSGKNFISSYPQGSRATFVYVESLGITWGADGDNLNIDLDFSVIGESGKVGYGGEPYNRYYQYSGDITRVPMNAVAMEKITCNNSREDAFVFCNYFNSPDNYVYTFFINSPTDTIKFSMSNEDKSSMLGVLKGKTFIFGSVSGSALVATNPEIPIDNLIDYLDTTLLFSDVVSMEDRFIQKQSSVSMLSLFI